MLTALSAQRGLVLDADALTSFAQAPDRLFEAIKSSQDRQVVLTPMRGNFHGCSAISATSIRFARSSKGSGGSPTLRRHRPAQRAGYGGGFARWPRDHRRQCAALARDRRRRRCAGGDDAGLLAQGAPAFEAACIGVWMHGEAAGEAGPGLIAEDLTEVLPAVFRRVYDKFAN